jgi:hypothetical protein
MYFLCVYDEAIQTPVSVNCYYVDQLRIQTIFGPVPNNVDILPQV